MPNNEIDGSLFTERVTKYQLIDLLTGNPPRKVIQALVGLLNLVVVTKEDFTGLKLPIENVS